TSHTTLPHVYVPCPPYDPSLRDALPIFGSPLGPEWTALDIDTKTRGKRTDESLEIIARLWREESVDFAGRHYRLKGASISPKPVDRKSTRLNSSHLGISYAVFCLKKNTQ